MFGAFNLIFKKSNQSAKYLRHLDACAYYLRFKVQSGAALISIAATILTLSSIGCTPIGGGQLLAVDKGCDAAFQSSGSQVTNTGVEQRIDLLPYVILVNAQKTRIRLVDKNGLCFADITATPGYKLSYVPPVYPDPTYDLTRPWLRDAKALQSSEISTCENNLDSFVSYLAITRNYETSFLYERIQQSDVAECHTLSALEQAFFRVAVEDQLYSFRVIKDDLFWGRER
jgi:hypothetical protein